MTEQIKSAIEEFNEIVEDIDERGESPCYFGEDDLWYLKLAIRSLQAWKEVLQELEDIKEDVKESNFEYCIGKLNGLNKAIDIINRKLAEIEEVR